MAGQAAAAEDRAAASEEATVTEAMEKSAVGSDPSKEPWAAWKQLRSCVASMADSKAFGRLVAAEAQERDFYRAQRKASAQQCVSYGLSTLSP